MTNRTAKDKPASQMLTVEQMEQVIAEQGKRIFELENAGVSSEAKPDLKSAIQALAPAAAEGEREAVLSDEQILANIKMATGWEQIGQWLVMKPSVAVNSTIHEKDAINFARRLISAQPASVPATSVAAGAVTDEQILQLAGDYSYHQGPTPVIAFGHDQRLLKFARALLALAAASTEPPKDEREAFIAYFDPLTSARCAFSGEYANKILQAKFEGWQARASLAAAPQQDPAMSAFYLAAREVCFAAHALANACLAADQCEELGNVDGALLDQMAHALAKFEDAERSHPHHLNLIDEGDIPQAAQPQTEQAATADTDAHDLRQLLASWPQEAGQVREVPDATIDELAERFDLLSIQDGGRVDADTLRNFVRAAIAQASPAVPEDALLEAAKAFAQAHIECDEMEARDDLGIDLDAELVSDHEYETKTAAYNTTKAALIAAYRASIDTTAAPSAPAGEKK